jgi:hypothetical protein
MSLRAAALVLWRRGNLLYKLKYRVKEIASAKIASQ